MRLFPLEQILVVVLCCPICGLFAAVPDGGSEYSAGFEKLSSPMFRSRFMVKGEMFVLNKEGKQLISPTSETREWLPGKTGKIDKHWSVKARGIQDVNIHHIWQIKEGNSVDIKISQFQDADYTKPIKEETKVLEDFAPLTWVAEIGKTYRVVLRFTPQLEPVREGEASEKMQIGGDRGSFEVTDNQGYLWSDNVRFGGILAGLTSHRGSFVVSYYPFKGAKEVGYAYGKVMQLNFTEDLRVKIRSETDLVPGEKKIKVYGRYYPAVKSETPNSATSYGQMRLEGFPKELQ